MEKLTDDGFTVIENIFTPAETTAILAEIRAANIPFHPSRGIRIFSLSALSTEVSRLSTADFYRGVPRFDMPIPRATLFRS